MAEERSPLIEFSLDKHADLSHMARRVRLLAALAELPQKQREDLARAVTDVCRHLLSQDVRGRVQFSLVTDAGQHFLEVIVQDEGGGESGAVRRLEARARQQQSAESQALRRLGEIIDFFQLEGRLGAGALARLRQLLPPTFHVPSSAEAMLWRRMIQQKSLEDAILVASQRARRVQSDSDAMRDRHALRDELAGQTEDAESLFSLIASETDNFIVVMDASGGITWVNKAFERMTGYSAPEINRRRLDELLGGPGSRKEVLRELRQALREGHRFSNELLLYRKDGRSCWTHFTLTPVRGNEGLVTRWIAIGTDVTQRHQAMEALAASKEAAEAASRAKSEFLANMSHEIRTPLNAIIGMTELALGTKLTREQREYLTTVRMSAESLLELLNDVLDLSKIEAGKLSIDHVDFNLADLLRDTVRALAVRAHAKGVEIACHVPMNVPQWLRGDPVRLRQILVNLVGNAIKFTSQGEVVVTVEPQWQNDNEIGLHFCVADTGVGIPRDRLQRIFEAFEQADTSTTRQFGGTGLGLTITAELLRMMGGRIWVESQPGKGSRFHFSLTFPIVQDPPEIRRAEMSELEGLRVLVVDDNATNRRILKEVLTHWRMQPTLVESGQAALDEIARRAREGPAFDVILLDAMMPGMDGFEAARTLRDRPDLKAGTVLMLSSADRPDSSDLCEELGIAAYMLKPISPSALLEAIQHTVGRDLEAAQSDLAESEERVDRPQRKLRVLVADDHEANRHLATAVLQKRGHTCVAAVDGADVVQKYQAADPPIDVILMDIQMPNVDGFEATARIRELERDRGSHTPIIALTAHAMKGDREKCLSAGMDAYLSKPLRPRELVTLVESVSNSVASRPLEHDSTAQPASIDFSYALDRLDGEDDLLRSQMQFFLKDGPALIDDIRSGTAAGDTERVQRGAHRLKGLLAGYGRDEAARLASRIEQDAADGDLSRAAELCDPVERDVHALVEGIRMYLSAEPD